MRARRVLILAGTAEARTLAEALHERGIAVISSFAGVTKDPALPPGEIRMGGFGGSPGLLAYLRDAEITHLVDATHPFALQMSTHAHEAARQLDLPLLRLERPSWPRDESWVRVHDVEAASMVLPRDARVLLTTGHRGLSSFFRRPDLSGVVRTIEPVNETIPPKWQVLLQRPPYGVEGEAALMKHHAITHLVTKNSGGDATVAKLSAARTCGIAVVMIERPVKPACDTVFGVADALDWLGN